VVGDLVMCDAAVRVPEYGPGWDEEDRAEWYGAPVSAFVVNDNTFRLVAGPVAQDASGIPFHIEPPLSSLTVDWRVLPGTNASQRIRYARATSGAPIRFEGRWAKGTNGWSAELAVTDPARVFGELLKRTLERRGIIVSGSVRTVHSGHGCPTQEWDRWTSEPLSRRLGLCLKPSQNLHAQLLLAEVGRHVEQEGLRAGTPTPHRSHDAWGLSRLPVFLNRAGIADGSVRLEEGSGLSRSNRVTPNATVALLRFMAQHPDRTVWKDSLPVGGVDGTLRHRFKTTPAKGNVRAKTGSLRGVHALGGYANTAGGDELIFAIYANESQGDPQARARMDRFVEVLAGAGPMTTTRTPPSIPPR
jgi:D-alanyl-D-alanine carboxypeptidase/D-alanyl-D-alanine-endopeptidase (penicillin-binding protein 4)